MYYVDELKHQVFNPRKYSYFLKLDAKMVSLESKTETSKCMRDDVSKWINDNLVSDVTFIRSESCCYIEFSYFEDALLFKMKWGW